MEEEGQHSLECIQANQIFPRKPPVLEEENLQVPFPELHGEFTEYVGRAEDAVIAISSYRLHIKFKESIVNVPLQLIESVECRDIFQLHVTCKDCKVIRCQFSTFEQCQEWLKRLTGATRPPSRLEDLFSFAFHAWCVDFYAGEKEQHGELCRPGDHVTSRFKNEVERMGFDTQNAWRVSEINNKYRLCPSYPQLLLVPAWITDKELENVAAFRSWKRFPAVVYRHQSTGAVIARCGQPEVSWWGWRNADDEHLVQSIARACAVDTSLRKHLANGSCTREYPNGTDLSDTDFDSSMTNSSEVETMATQPQKLLILDARSYAAAVANRAKGGGCECPEYYPNCEVVFMGMANIHSIRKSFQSLRFLCTQMPDPANWLSALESTKWLQHLSLMLKAALLVVNAVDRDHRPVLVHCSDGWDRTPQIVALSKLLLDPYYRTIEGFQVLVETEWLDFGHKFADRCGHGENSEDVNERCPVFLQWLDCVHQLQRQFPCSFEFNEAFLVKLVQHTYSCLFGTFLCNSGKEREDQHIQERTCSVWSLLRPANRAFRNMLYSSHSETVLHPVCHVRNLMLWTAVYLPSSSPTTPSDDSCAPYPEDPLPGRLPKTRSFDNLPSALEVGGSLAPNRRSSDPSLNEKWQDHRRSLELNIGAGPEGGGLPDPDGRSSNTSGVGSADGWPDRELEGEKLPAEVGEGLEEGKILRVTLPGEESMEEVELSVGVAEGQMENILQEATKEDAGLETQKGAGACNPEGAALDSEAPASPSVAPPVSAGLPVGVGTVEEDASKEYQGIELGQAALEIHPSPEDTNGAVASNPSLPDSSGSLTNGHAESFSGELGASAENRHEVPHLSQRAVEALELREDRISLMESSTETLTEEGAARQDVPGQLSTSPLSRVPPDDKTPSHYLRRKGPIEAESEEGGSRTLRPSPSALPPLCAELGQQGSICNGETPEAEPRVNSQRSPLSRQVSAASCGSLPPVPLRGPGRCPQRPPSSPEQPTRSHLDDDGLPVHSDMVQQRLRQIEAGHQLEVETLKRQVQELRSRLEIQQQGGGLRVNGDVGDEVTSITDSECNLDANCLSRCSTELFSEASWEQVDKQDAEVTRWYPDHLAAQCYGCESRFWLATRKHHCRNCGNVFCATCCDQKIPVPSQQLFQPSRVCKACYGSLQLSAAPRELEKPIAASSN
ncbi:phosphatidylinositol-3,5-bisphosphate 3-phosphatase MTMR3 isoform X2 [Scleropages formosus]|uniref:phosphatidylinositol-3,5-bisphosphate 3-phosphatase n=1 Tax=Scleropages formosus TaxID=113540 RepID=A0A8C9VMH9_SCLFO|nr:myotubularin-related protein 3 isoform X2 [Scleropages formosus]